MIVAKTKMRKIPDGCGKCRYGRGLTGSYWCLIEQHWKIPTNMKISRERPKWCPLMEVDDNDT